MLFHAAGHYELLSATITPELAIQYFNKHVAGLYKIKFGHIITIHPRDWHFLFDNHNPQKGKFRWSRARRLPWVIPTMKSKNVYILPPSQQFPLKSNEIHREIYLCQFIIPGNYVNYYGVILSLLKNGARTFNTARFLTQSQFYKFQNLPKLAPPFPA